MKKYYEHKDIVTSLGNIDFLKVRRNAGFSFDYARGREKNGFVFVEKGVFRVSFLNEKGNVVDAWDMNSSEVVFIPAGTRYRGEYLLDDTTITIAQFDIISGSLPSQLSLAVKIPMYDAERQIKHLFDQPALLMSEEERSYFCVAKIYDMIWSALSSIRKDSPKYRKLAPALKELQKNFYKQEKISYYADLCLMSEAGFRRLFREYTGKSPIEYRNAIRLEEARKLIETGEYLVAEAAVAVGYTNISFFCRSYKSVYGITPLFGK